MLGIGVIGDLTDLTYIRRNNITYPRYENTSYFVSIVNSAMTSQYVHIEQTNNYIRNCLHIIQLAIEAVVEQLTVVGLKFRLPTILQI